MALLDDLLELNLVERQLRGLQSRVSSAETYHRVQQRQMAEIKQRREELGMRRKQRQVTIHGYETDAKTAEDRLEKLRADLNTATNTKQYATVLEEMNTLKASHSGIDDMILSEMADVESLDTELQAVDSDIDKRQTVLDSAVADLDERKAEIAERVAELQKDRDVKAAVIPASTLDTFDRCADDFEGDAMAAIEEIDKRRREYCCGSCNLNLPFNVVVQLMSRSDALVQCENCLRILFVTPQMKAETVSK